MFCKQCRNTKLRREFPSVTLTDECNHAPLHCLRCVTHSVKNANMCSQCSKNVTTDNLRYLEFVETLERLFPETPHLLTETTDAASEDANPTISVFKLGGESTVFEYQPGMTVEHLKLLVKERLGTLPEKQRLLHKDQELKTHLGSKLATLQDYDVQPFSTVHLIVVLYEIPDQSLDHTKFDLWWSYSSDHCDYLDASVLIYSGTDYQGLVDFQRPIFTGVSHSSDVMDDSKCLGHHTIDVWLKSLPATVDKLFFTLSAYMSPTISEFKHPSLRFFDAEKPDKQLCSDQMQNAAYSQAIIMCSLSKINGSWKVFGLRTPSAGNVTHYDPLRQKIAEIILQGLC